MAYTTSPAESNIRGYTDLLTRAMGGIIPSEKIPGIAQSFGREISGGRISSPKDISNWLSGLWDPSTSNAYDVNRNLSSMFGQLGQGGEDIQRYIRPNEPAPGAAGTAGQGQDWRSLLKGEIAKINAPPSVQFQPFEMFQPGSLPEQYFNQYIKTIAAPSSVEQVQRGLESQILETTLQDIDKQTKQAMGETTSSMMERGVLAPGQTSDIAENARAQILGQGVEAGAKAREGIAQAEIGREAQKEQAIQQAYGQRYQVGAQAAYQAAGLQQQAQLQSQQLYSNAQNQIMQVLMKEDISDADRQVEIQKITNDYNLKQQELQAQIEQDRQRNILAKQTMEQGQPSDFERIMSDVSLAGGTASKLAGGVKDIAGLLSAFPSTGGGGKKQKNPLYPYSDLSGDGYSSSAV